jgi:SAM-dependent methyltransferase
MAGSEQSNYASRTVSELDRWARWLLDTRFGGDAEELERTLQNLRPVRDRVLASAEIQEGDVVLDVGTGDGLIGFGALELVGERGRVVFSDVSADLLARCREIAEGTPHGSRCDFLKASADDLAPVADESVDVVTTRSVLIYVEFNFDERELLQYARVAGFPLLRLEYEAVIERTPPIGGPTSWNAFYHHSGNPNEPSVEQVVRGALTQSEADRFEEHLRPLVERGEGTGRWAVAYLTAEK